MYKITFLSVCLIATMCAISFVGVADVFAQSTGVLQGVFLSASPEHPQAGDSVQLQLKSSSVDLDRSSMTWYVDGAVTQRGFGVKEQVIKAPDVGKEKNVSVEITDQNDSRTIKRYTVRPQNVDIIWNSDTYTPPWYRGKSLYTRGSSVVFTAVPNVVLSNGKTVRSQDLFYTWEVNGGVIANAKGVGKTNATLSLPASRSSKVAVMVETLDGSYKAYKQIDLEAEEPDLVLYEVSPLLGMVLNRALGATYVLQAREVTFTAVPYFFSTPLMNMRVMEYEWFLNNQKIETFTNTEVFRLENQNSGEINISVEAGRDGKIFQRDAVKTNIIINN